MSFADDLKRSLGFEETESAENKNEGPGISEMLRNILNPSQNQEVQPNNQNPNSQTTQNPKNTQNYRPAPKPTPVYDEFEVIIPEQSFYEIVLIRPKTIDDINYVVDQVVEEQNPVIVDLSFLEKESTHNFKLAADKINQMRSKFGAQAVLLARSEEKNLIIISPRKVKVINKK